MNCERVHFAVSKCSGQVLNTIERAGSALAITTATTPAALLQQHLEMVSQQTMLLVAASLLSQVAHTHVHDFIRINGIHACTKRVHYMLHNHVITTFKHKFSKASSLLNLQKFSQASSLLNLQCTRGI